MKFTIKVTINASAKEIYEAWLDSEGHSDMTGSEADVSNTIGGRFTAWDGYISGKNLALVPFKSIKQSWRTTEFQDDDKDSTVEIKFHQVDGSTEITLIHSNLQHDGGHYKKGWEDFYFQPMKAYFSK